MPEIWAARSGQTLLLGDSDLEGRFGEDGRFVGYGIGGRATNRWLRAPRCFARGDRPGDGPLDRGLSTIQATLDSPNQARRREEEVTEGRLGVEEETGDDDAGHHLKTGGISSIG